MQAIKRQKHKVARESSNYSISDTIDRMMSRDRTTNSSDRQDLVAEPESITEAEPGNATATDAAGRTDTRRHDTEGGKSSKSSKHKKHHIPIGGQIKYIFLGSWVNVFLVFVPIGIAMHFAHVNPTIVFVMNFLAIVPLAGLLSQATEELALRVGEVLGGLLNATFGNAVELIVSIIALVKDEVLIVQTSLIGSILSNLLLVLGMAFVVGGYNRVEQNFNTTVAQTASSLLALAVGSLIVPTAFHEASANNDDGIIQLSRATSIILLLVYISYLVFQLKSHKSLFSSKSEKSKKRDISNLNVVGRFRNHRKGKKEGKLLQKTENGDASKPATPLSPVPGEKQEGATETGESSTTTQKDASHRLHMPTLFHRDENGSRPTSSAVADEEEDDEEEEEEPQLSVITAFVLLAIATVLVALCAEFMVDSINDLVETAHLSRVFVGLILLPIVGNAAEHYTAVTVAAKDKMDLSIGVAVGSSMQIALLVIPFVVILGWILGKDDMTLFFDVFQVTVMFVSVLLVNYLIQDGKSNYLEGNLLLSFYVIIAVAAWYYPKDAAAAEAAGKLRLRMMGRM